MSDAMELFRSMRPSVPEAADSPASGRGRDLHDLAMVPGSAAYKARIPPPPCFQCGEDHVPGQSYNHSWTPEPPPLAQVHDEPVSASAVIRRAPVLEVESAPRRVALYVGRHDTYVVAVEEPPDWDAVNSFKVEPHQVMPLINLARALGVKVADKTGGDLFMLEQDDVGQHAQADGGGAAGVRGDSPRRQGPDADRPEEGQLEGAQPSNGAVPGGRRQRGRAAG